MFTFAFKQTIVVTCRRCISTRVVANEELVRERFFGMENRESLIKGLKKTARFRFTKPPQNAAVMIPLCNVDGKLSILYTLRSAGLYSHGGQVSFPGGKVDDTDASRTHTALRECEEELGIKQDNVDAWVELQPFPDRNRKYLVTPVLCYIRDFNTNDLVPSKEEVQDVFTVPITELLQPRNQGYTSFRNGWTFPTFPNFKHQVWGMTAVFTEIILFNAFPDLYAMRTRPPNRKLGVTKKWL